MLAAGLKPLTPYPGRMNLPWSCLCLTCGDGTKPRLGHVLQGGRGCRRCGNADGAASNRVPEDEAVAEMLATGLQPLVPYPGAMSPWSCKCLDCAEEVRPRLASIRRGHRGCRNCAEVARAAARRLPEDDAVAVMIAAGYEPLVPYPGAGNRWPSRCLTCGDEITPRLSHVRRGEGGCQRCGNAASVATRRTPEDEAVAVMIAAGLRPAVPYPGSQFPWPCRCLACGDEVRPRLSTIRRGQGGCRRCGYAASAAASRIPASEAVAFMLAANLQPLDPYPGSQVPWLCQCLVCDQNVTPALSTIRRGGGCKRCADAALAIARRTPEVEAAAFMLAANLQPLVPYPGSQVPWLCQCLVCEQNVTPALSAVRQGGGCRCCAERAFDFVGPASVYLITHQSFRSHKIGVTGARARNDRLAEHARHGWRLFQQVRLSSGEQAYKVEQAILRRMRTEFGFGSHLSADEMPQGGWTETVSAGCITLNELWGLIESELMSKYTDR